MKRLLMMLLCLSTFAARAQVRLNIASGARFIVSGTPQVVMDSGTFVNDGVYRDSSGTFLAHGGLTFSGTGTTDMYYMVVNNTQSTLVDAPVSVYNTATLLSGNMDANNKLHIRSDENLIANMVVDGVLTNSVLGIIARPTITASCNPFTSVITLNISGTAMEYQWQTSPDSATWVAIPGATNEVCTAYVATTAYYRCALSTNNSSFSQATAGVKLEMTMGPITGDSVVCVGTSAVLANSLAGGTWTSSNPAVAVVGSASGIVTGVGNGTATISYSVSGGCVRVKQVRVGLPPITGTTNICIGTTSTLANAVPGGTWSSSAPFYATVDAATGVVTGVHVGVARITYTIATGCFTTVTVNIPNIVLNIAGGLNGCPGQTTTLTVPGYPGGAWTTANSAVATINASTGLMTGVSVGTTNITYTYSTCFKTAVATINPLPATVTGPSVVCVGSTISLACSTPGGVWSSGNIARATVNTAGVVTGVLSGTARISYTLSTGCVSSVLVTVGAMPAAISGTMVVCAGNNVTLTCAAPSGTWTSAAPAVATVVTLGTFTGLVTGVAAGTATISYTTPGGCLRTAVVTVNPSPGPITGSLSVCVGSTTALAGSVSGGTWQSSTTARASVGLASGVVTGISAGTANITYRTAPTCFATAQVTVAAPGAITGPTGVCVGATVTLTHAVSGGTWISGNAARATVDAATGVVTGVSAGVVTISYMLSPTCYTTKSVTVSNNPAGITGPTSVCVGSTITVTSSGGGAWSSSDTSIARISAGVVTGVSAGVANISYTITATGCYFTRPVTVNALPAAITGSSTVCVSATTTFTSATAGGTWTSATPGIGSIGAATGVFTGVTGGSTNVRYTLASGCQVSRSVTVNNLPGTISGFMPVCVGNTTSLSSATAGATWSISDTTRAVIVSTTTTSATISGVTAGTAIVSYTNALGCSRTSTVTVDAAVAPVTGADVICVGNSAFYTCATPGGVWSISSGAAASIVVATGQVNGAAVGTANVTYTKSAGCKAWKTITVNGAVSAVTGATAVCEGAATTFANTTSGGTWISANAAIATVDSSSGVVSGIAAGTANISYIVSVGCFKTKVITVKVLPVVSGPTWLLAGTTTTFTATPAAGVWASSTPSVATVGTTGIVNGLTLGTTVISYTVSGCAGISPLEIVAAPLRPGGLSDDAAELFRVFPNPTHGALSVQTSVAGKLAIFTIDGRMVYEAMMNPGVNDASMSAALAAGFYLCRFTGTDGSTHVVRLVYEP